MTEARTLAIEARAPRFVTDGALLSVLRPPITPAELRTVRLLALALYLHGTDRIDWDPLRPWLSGALSIENAAAAAGLRGGDLETARRLLTDQGLLHRDPARGYVLAASLFEPAPVAGALPWGRIASALHGRSAALLVTWALAIRLPAPDTAVTASLAELTEWTGYSRNQVRTGVRDAEAAGVLRRTEQPGESPRYRLLPGEPEPSARSASASPATASTSEPEPPPGPPAPPASAPSSAQPPVARPGTDTGRIPVRFGPVRLHLDPAATIDVTVDVQPDGRVIYRGPGFEIGPLPAD